MRAWRPDKKISSMQVFTLLMTAGVIFLILPKGLTDRLDHLFSMALSPLTKPTHEVSLAVSEQVNRSISGSVSEEQYRELEKQYLRLQNRLVNEKQQNEQLQQTLIELSGLRQRFGLASVNVIPSHVIGGSSTNQERRLILDRGGLDHVREGQVVLAPVDSKEVKTGDDPDLYSMCVVGRISKGGVKTSNIQLTEDAGFSLPVSIVGHWSRKEDWRAEGILRGMGMGKMQVSMVSVEGHPVQPGDLVLACGNPEYLPVDMIVGVVWQCQADDRNPLMWKITAIPVADLSSLSQVMVLDCRWEQ